LVPWPIADFHHLHFVKIRHSGLIWDSDWQFIGNPLDELSAVDDDIAPNFSNAYGTQLFGFCQNESESYFSQGETLAGDVDIICRVSDLVNHTWQVAPYRLEYKIEGDSSIPWTNSVCFTGPLAWDSNVDVVYQDDSYCNSYGDYDLRIFNFNLTNTDGDSIIESEDRLQTWPTAFFHNGQYTVYARAYDRAGNSTTESLTVSVENYFSLGGNIITDDGNPQLSGVLITLMPDNRIDTTTADGSFSMAAVGGGSQHIIIERAAYETVDTTLMMNQHRQLDIVMRPGIFVLGDVNFDTEVNVGDAVFIINYVFHDGPAPMPFASGDANSDLIVNIGDAVFLMNYIFHDGPPPGEGRSPLWSDLPKAE
jgi:hypothetical protein